MSVAPDHDVCDTANDKPNIIFLSGCILIFTEALLIFFSEYPSLMRQLWPGSGFAPNKRPIGNQN